jgi:hypothetical protein
MEKSIISILLAASVIAFCLIPIPNVSCQPENVKVLSYSWYLDTYNGALVVVGEVQNTGSNIIDNVTMVGFIFTPDGTAQAAQSTQVFGAQILPQEKAPFYIQFSPQSSYTGDFSWLSEGIYNVTFVIYSANPTTSSQYQGLTVSSKTSSVDSSGFYEVTGTVLNTGAQTTNQTWVVGTFYNDTGSVVAIGYSNYLTPTAIAPGGTASFTVYAFDSDLNGLASQINSYALLIQTSTTAPAPAPTPSSSPSSSPTPTSSSSSPTPTQPGTGTSPSNTYLYILAAVVIVIVIVAVALVLRKRRGSTE